MSALTQPQMACHIMRTSWEDDHATLKFIRDAVFIKEQNVPEEMEWDDEDDTSVHFLALDEEHRPLGCIRLLPSGKLSRLAVLEPYRNSGVGRALLEAAIEEARSRGLEEVHLHAQTHATSFYETAGFTVSGGTFLEAGIPHRHMTKLLG